MRIINILYILLMFFLLNSRSDEKSIKSLAPSLQIFFLSVPTDWQNGKNRPGKKWLKAKITFLKFFNCQQNCE